MIEAEFVELSPVPCHLELPEECKKGICGNDSRREHNRDGNHWHQDHHYGNKPELAREIDQKLRLTINFSL